MPLEVVDERGEEREHADDLYGHEAAVVQLGLRAPAQERGHVLSQLRRRRRRAVRVLRSLENNIISINLIW